MVILLFAAGGVAILSSLVLGFQSGSVSVFFHTALNGAFLGLILFALALLLERQEAIQHKLQGLEYFAKSAVQQKQKVCAQCEQPYDVDRSSCPHCGYRGANR